MLRAQAVALPAPRLPAQRRCKFRPPCRAHLPPRLHLEWMRGLRRERFWMSNHAGKVRGFGEAGKCTLREGAHPSRRPMLDRRRASDRLTRNGRLGLWVLAKLRNRETIGAWTRRCAASCMARRACGSCSAWPLCLLHNDRLDVHKFLDAVVREFAAEAAFLDAAERQARIAPDRFVYETAAGF